MKTKVLLVLISVFIISCSQDDNTSVEKTAAELLLGSWSNVSYENGQTTFQKVSELPDDNHGFTFKEEFPTCIEKTFGWCATPPLTFFDAERTYELEENNLKIYDVLITHHLNAQPVLLYNYNIISVDENELVVENNIDEQTLDYNDLQELFNEIYQMVMSVSCEDVSEWSFIAYGSKACGGPQGYLPYPSNINVSVLEELIETYTQMEHDYNIEYGIASTCDITPQPTGVVCVNGSPQLVY